MARTPSSSFFRYSLLSIKDVNFTWAPASLDRGENDLPAIPEDLSESRHLTDSIVLLYSQACDLREKFFIGKAESTLHKLIELDRQGLALTSDRSSLTSRTSEGSSHTPFPTYSGPSHLSYFHCYFLYSLAYDLCTLYEELGSHSCVVQESVDQLQELLKCPTLDDTLRHFALEVLSYDLQLLHDAGIDKDGLSRAVDFSRTARDLIPYLTTRLPFSLESNLVFYLGARYKVEHRIKDLDEAINVCRQDLESAVSLPDERRLKFLVTHTTNLRARSDHTDTSLEDLEEAIHYDRELLEYFSNGPDRATWLSLLADDLCRHFQSQGDFDFLQEAISIDHEILQLLPTNHEHYEQSLKNLLLDLRESFAQISDAETLIEYIHCDKQLLKEEIDDTILYKASECLKLSNGELPVVFDWWQGRVLTNDLVKVVAPILHRKPSQYENLVALLTIAKSEPTYQILTDNKDSESMTHFITLLSSEGDGEIIPASPRARSIPVMMTSQALRHILRSPNPMAKLISIDPLLTPSVMQLLQLELDSTDSDQGYRRVCLQVLQKLSRMHHVLPPSLFLKNIALSSNAAYGGGGFADIWKGTLGQQPVCVKVLRMFLDSNAKLRSKLLHAFCSEALLWRQLRHQNVLPLLGVNTSLFAPSFCFISPWMQNGDINQHMKVNPAFNKLNALTDIMAGLAYLHGLTPPVIHGDLRGANILVTSDEPGCPPRCCLADFGLALVAETQTLTSTSEIRGASRWLSPEHIDPSAFRDHDLVRDRLPARDVYAFACTVIEILTEKPPFFGQLLTDSAVIIEVLSGVRPFRPESVWCTDELWSLVEQCWVHNPQDRPSATFLHSRLQSMLLESSQGF